ncbi:hypothetical protein BFJ66_g9122 [Fusarium oxysporum f. sp. cepae]|uniref:Uncharacterized protein n=1 Tax=Fusarium oxysporum f. sp. cepae TaxID=396571 RepID=A0A3L6MXJ5_FUSOX|nr:hypothetical protein BFJ65_g16525 [Fusarium oxysporum f. sp. cepae]RKK37062.1 hypothetical protein BFJ67_g12516 [Fusarium oxysporum f. sp. cepae]RKK45356.1 hypothetical protein BFJ66_g9122 [Fusarium oxysporum f. sp. cepae]RKK88696.1 hypothetical protein BFJ71_g12852 [Fusarium oxysporum]
MIDPIGAVAAATASIDQSLRLIRRVSTAIEIHKNGRKDLEFIFEDLSSIAQVIELVQTIEEIRTKGVLKALANMLKHAEKLHDHVQQVKKKSNTGSTFRRAAHHFMTGPEDLEHANRVVKELASLKTTLILHIQVAHVGLVVQNDQDKRANPDCTHMLDSSVLHEVNQVVEQRLGKGQGLKIAEVLRGKSADDDGMIRLSQEEYECLVFHSLDDSQSNQELGTIRVANNQTFDQALQINGFISDDWMEFTQNLTIEDNEARNQSIQVNVPTSRQDFVALLANRNQTLEMMPSSAWAPAPLMPKQNIRSLK